MNEENKIILITGASSDLGKALAQFYSPNNKLILNYYQNREKLKNVDGDKVYLDLSSEESIQNLFNYVKEKYGHVDLLINNAAISLDNYYMDKTKEEFMKVLEVNLVGTFLMIKYFEEIMKDGYIVNISSTDGIDTGNVYSVDYNASKAGINLITKNLSLVSNNKIISICPNWINTSTTKMMDKNYLEKEMKRIGQKALISVKKVVEVINDSLKNQIENGSIIRIDGDNDVRRIS